MAGPRSKVSIQTSELKNDEHSAPFDLDQCDALARAEDDCWKDNLWNPIMFDSQIRRDVIDELEFDPRFNGERVGVAVDENVVTLAGHVNS